MLFVEEWTITIVVSILLAFTVDAWWESRVLSLDEKASCFICLMPQNTGRIACGAV